MAAHWYDIITGTWLKVTTTNPMPVTATLDTTDVETLLGNILSELGLLTTLIDATSGGLKVNPRDKSGDTINLPLLTDYVSGNASNTDGTSTAVLASGGGSVRRVITDVTITNTSATDIYVELKDGATTKWTFPAPAHSGVTHRFETPLVGTAATAWNFDPSAAATTIYCSVSGYNTSE